VCLGHFDLNFRPAAPPIGVIDMAFDSLLAVLACIFLVSLLGSVSGAVLAVSVRQ
jgi:hypothetical protein